MNKLDPVAVKRIKELRRTGHSFPEIRKMTGCGYGTVLRYTKKVEVLAKYRDALREKQGGSKIRAQIRWGKARESIFPLLGKLNARDKLLILAALYWGEGTKKELNIINSNADLLRVFVSCIEALGVKRTDLSFSLRTFSDISLVDARKYWARQFKISPSEITSAEVVQGKKSGKLPYGMCRIRMRKGEWHFKQIMSMIELIASQIGSPRSTMDSAAAS